MWPFSSTSKYSTNSALLNSIQLRDELAFREAAKAYLKWIQDKTASVAKLEETYVSGELGGNIISQNSVQSMVLATCLTDSTRFLREWRTLDWDEKHSVWGGRGLSKKSFERSIRINREIIEAVLRYIDTDDYKTKKLKTSKRAAITSKRVFVVHGHEHEARDQVVDVLKSFGFIPIVLHDQPNLGRTVIEKFEQNADVGFAVVLLTPDDVGASKSDSVEGRFGSRARQNVLLELGYFIARLGRDRVCALRKGNVEVPSDIFGVVFLDFDEVGAWRIEMSKELLAAGYEVDLRLLAQRAKASA